MITSPTHNSNISLFDVLKWVLGPMLTTMVIYFLFRSHDMVYFEIASALQLDNVIVSLQQLFNQLDWTPGYIVKYNLPSALWLFAFQSLIIIQWGGRINRTNIGWISVPLVIAVGSELIQLLGFTDGTFDVLDLILYVLASVLSLTLVHTSFNLKLRSGIPYNHLTSLATVLMFTLIIGLADAL